MNKKITDLIVVENNKEDNLICYSVIQDGLAGGYSEDKMIYFPDEKKAQMYPDFINCPIVLEHNNETEKKNVYGVIVNVFQNLDGIVVNNTLEKLADGKWYAKFIIDKSKMTKQDVLNFKGVSTGYDLIKFQDKGVYNAIDLESKKLVIPEEIKPRHLALVMNPRYEECEVIITNSKGANQKEQTSESGGNFNNDVIMNDETKKEISSIVSQEMSNLKTSLVEEINNSVKRVINESKEEDKKDKTDAEMKNKKMYNFDGKDYSEEDVKNALKGYKKNSDDEDVENADEEDEEGGGKKTQNKKGVKNSKSNQSGVDMDNFSQEVINLNNKNIKTFENESKTFEEQYKIQILNSYKK